MKKQINCHLIVVRNLITTLQNLKIILKFSCIVLKKFNSWF